MNVIRLCLALLLTGIFCSAASADETLVLRGSGVRTKPIIGTLYELSLHVPGSLARADAATIIESDQPMTLTLVIKSRLVSRGRFVKTTTGGFEKAAASGYTSEMTQAFLDQFDGVEFRKGDTVVMRYADGALTTRTRTGAGDVERSLGTIHDATLKQALFAIWLGGKPAQDALKQALLGQ